MLTVHWDSTGKIDGWERKPWSNVFKMADPIPEFPITAGNAQFEL